jgi:hypothetical protein
MALVTSDRHRRALSLLIDAIGSALPARTVTITLEYRNVKLKSGQAVGLALAQQQLCHPTTSLAP